MTSKVAELLGQQKILPMSTGAGAINGEEVVQGSIQESRRVVVNSPGLTQKGNFYTVVSQKKKDSPARDRKAEK